MEENCFLKWGRMRFQTNKYYKSAYLSMLRELIVPVYPSPKACLTVGTGAGTFNSLPSGLG